MKKIAKIIQSSKTNPSYFASADLMHSVRSAIENWEDAEYEAIELCPRTEAYEVWLVPLEDQEWEEAEAKPLELGVYHKPPMAERVEGEEESYVYQPLLTGKRIQIHKRGAIVCAFDHNGNRLSGKVKIGETSANLSPVFLAIASIDSTTEAIFDAVLLAENNSVVVTDILRYGDCAAHEMSAVARMNLMEHVLEGMELLCTVDWSLDEKPETIARPAYGGYFSKWIVVPEGLGRNNGDKAGAGPGGMCVCPECGHEAEHKTGQACNERECSECGATMTRKED